MGCIKFIEGPVTTKEIVLKDVTAVKCGGHFDGSLILHWKKIIGISDTLMTVPVRNFTCDVDKPIQVIRLLMQH